MLTDGTLMHRWSVPQTTTNGHHAHTLLADWLTDIETRSVYVTGTRTRNRWLCLKRVLPFQETQTIPGKTKQSSYEDRNHRENLQPNHELEWWVVCLCGCVFLLKISTICTRIHYNCPTRILGVVRMCDNSSRERHVAAMCPPHTPARGTRYN